MGKGFVQSQLRFHDLSGQLQLLLSMSRTFLLQQPLAVWAFCSPLLLRVLRLMLQPSARVPAAQLQSHMPPLHRAASSHQGERFRLLSA
jgi:hypothetical protein